MKVAVIRFPGANCDQDAYFALNSDLGVQAEYVWHDDRSLAGFDAVFLPGGFAHGDYLRAGAIAARAPVMAEVHRFACEGRPVIGACNGFQVLCEAGLLPGALVRNHQQQFVCKTVSIQAVNHSSLWTQSLEHPLRVPIAHAEGRYVCDEQTLARLQELDLIAFRYCSSASDKQSYNPNGSLHDIAGVLNETGNVLGLMPHPERATNKRLGSDDGLLILRALQAAA